ncbi:MAG: helix-hairpin-helix domain-containing protein [Candidatus Limnocylindrales bacterium]
MDQPPEDRAPEAWRSIDVTPIEEAPPSLDPAARRRFMALGALAAICLLATAGLLLLSPTGSGPVAAGSDGGPAGSATPAIEGVAGQPSAPGAWMIDVGGAVARPGVYALPAGSRVADAIRAAGGFGPQVDASAVTSTLNLAEVLRDGQKIVVPQRGNPAQRSATGSAAGAQGGHGALIDLNSASASELDALPGVGPVTAAKIIAAREERPFRTVDELATRKVVSASVLAKIRGLVTVGG